MGQNQESFRDKLVKMAETVELLESCFKNNIDISINVEPNEFNEVIGYLNTKESEDTCIISIGNVNFTFLKT